MCKICTSCKGIMNYDPYFEAEICGRCGRIERKPRAEQQKDISTQVDGADILKRIVQTMMVHS